MLKDLHKGLHKKLVIISSTKIQQERDQNLRKMTKGNPLTPHKKSVLKQTFIIMRTNNHGLFKGHNVHHVLTQSLFKTLTPELFNSCIIHVRFIHQTIVINPKYIKIEDHAA